MQLIELGAEVEYIEIDTTKVPYTFSVKLTDRTYTFTIRYNDVGEFFTCLLYTSAPICTSMKLPSAQTPFLTYSCLYSTVRKLIFASSRAVSYTHLDVYKRQSQCLSCPIRDSSPAAMLTAMGRPRSRRLYARAS